MLQRKSSPPQLRVHAFLVGVEIEDGVCTSEQASMAISDALTFKEGVGAVDVTPLGEMLPEPEDSVE